MYVYIYIYMYIFGLTVSSVASCKHLAPHLEYISFHLQEKGVTSRPHHEYFSFRANPF